METTMRTSKYSKFLSRATQGVAYWARLAMRDFTEDLLRRMSLKQMNNSELATAAGVSPAYITKVLRGTENFTLETMTKLAMAVDGKLRIHIADRDASTSWVDISKGANRSVPAASQGLTHFFLQSTPAGKEIRAANVATAPAGSTDQMPTLRKDLGDLSLFQAVRVAPALTKLEG